MSLSPSDPTPRPQRHPDITEYGIRSFQESKMGSGGKPWMTVTTGQDSISTGVSARLWLPSRGRYANSERLISARWLAAPVAKDDLVRLTIRALDKYLENEGYEPREDGQ